VFQRAKYKDADQSWQEIKDPSATVKFDGASFFMPISESGSLSFFSRRPSVKGGYPDRTSQLLHLTDNKYPELAGGVYNVELIHTGFNKGSIESHRNVSGILNSLPDRSIATQHRTGPVRAVLLDVINPEIGTYAEKIKHLKKVESIIGKPDLIYAVTPVVGHAAIHDLIRSTKAQSREGVIITSLNTPEHLNTRLKVKHKILHNLRVVKVLQEFDIHGEPKPSMGALEVADASGRVVARVGTGFSRLQRIDAWEHPENWVGKEIQVESMGLAKDMLRAPVYNGFSDGDLDYVT
jgi:hypothetical protein